MKNTKVKIGTTVSYTKTSVLSEPKKLESVVTGCYGGYVSLLNGDKMFIEALTEVSKPSKELQRLHRSHNATKGRGKRGCIRKRMVEVIKFENQ
ncbi:hypothetical protein [uncultured Mediterranean phage uvMED]|nr:hypothetical protein [uncultured Mediterranean phage uvMED]